MELQKTDKEPIPKRCQNKRNSTCWVGSHGLARKQSLLAIAERINRKTYKLYKSLNCEWLVFEEEVIVVQQRHMLDLAIVMNKFFEPSFFGASPPDPNGPIVKEVPDPLEYPLHIAEYNVKRFESGKFKKFCVQKLLDNENVHLIDSKKLRNRIRSLNPKARSRTNKVSKIKERNITPTDQRKKNAQQTLRASNRPKAKETKQTGWENNKQNESTVRNQSKKIFYKPVMTLPPIHKCVIEYYEQNIITDPKPQQPHIPNKMIQNKPEPQHDLQDSNKTQAQILADKKLLKDPNQIAKIIPNKIRKAKLPYLKRKRVKGQPKKLSEAMNTEKLNQIEINPNRMEMIDRKDTYVQLKEPNYETTEDDICSSTKTLIPTIKSEEKLTKEFNESKRAIKIEHIKELGSKIKNINMVKKKCTVRHIKTDRLGNYNDKKGIKEIMDTMKISVQVGPSSRESIRTELNPKMDEESIEEDIYSSTETLKCVVVESKTNQIQIWDKIEQMKELKSKKKIKRKGKMKLPVGVINTKSVKRLNGETKIVKRRETKHQIENFNTKANSTREPTRRTAIVPGLIIKNSFFSQVTPKDDPSEPPGQMPEYLRQYCLNYITWAVQQRFGKAPQTQCSRRQLVKELALVSYAQIQPAPIMGIRREFDLTSYAGNYLTVNTPDPLHIIKRILFWCYLVVFIIFFFVMIVEANPIFWRWVLRRLKYFYNVCIDNKFVLPKNFNLY